MLLTIDKPSRLPKVYYVGPPSPRRCHSDSFVKYFIVWTFLKLKNVAVLWDRCLFQFVLSLRMHGFIMQPPGASLASR